MIFNAWAVPAGGPPEAGGSSSPVPGSSAAPGWTALTRRIFHGADA